MTGRRMQGRIGPLALVAFTATMLMGGCDASFYDNGDDSADYAQVCTDAAGNAQPDSDCDNAPDDYTSDAYDSHDPYMWRYYPAPNLVIVPYGQRMPSAGVVRKPVTITVPAAGGSGGSSRPAKIQTPSSDQAGGTLTKSGSSSAISRGGFGVKGASGGKGSAGSAGS